MAEVQSKAPTHLWIVGIISLLWNGFGAYDYIMSKSGSEDYFLAMAGDAAAAREMIDYLAGFPWWANAGWLVGVWAALAGSILLLMRNSHAVIAFLLSLIGMATGVIYNFVGPEAPAAMTQGLGMIVMWIIVGFGLFQFLYARAMAARGVLR